jgi:hypothetical protein
MFMNLFDGNKIETAWTYGALTCKTFFREGINMPFLQEDSAAKASAETAWNEVLSTLEVLVRIKRKDILS